ncbi:PREDICTED: nicotinamide riboside kinase 2-like isoform X1 [Branchiostoma belcheri]|uniref:Nicotinamide riboside kinase 2-like isoform X1 n=1 Tax=Branchiostoma belcheri TaxID=7741 RepID=A0A6P4YR24_BRABE|nr:PREDICTED: nicotinamide riboside kinase 2-like isoform X1 [Branchiostoma belcheri]
MKKLVIGIGGVSNGGKTTLTSKLKNVLPNCYSLHQDSYDCYTFHPDSLGKEPGHVQIDPEHGWMMWDELSAVHNDVMLEDVKRWLENPAAFSQSATSTGDSTDVHVLLIEGFLIYNYRPLEKVFDARYSFVLPFEEARRRRLSRTYTPPDSPGFFEGHVWPMYLKYKNELLDLNIQTIDLDGTKPVEENFERVKTDILDMIKHLKDSQI